MNYEQKYKDALENARQEYNTTENVERKEWLEEIFPELKESEDDKIVDAIRKALESKIEDLGNGVTKTACLAWLKKQGKQKPADKVEPKFKKGEWIINEEDVWQIDEVKTENYLLIDSEGNLFAEEIAKIDSEFHIWTIQDAKEGDALVCPKYAGDTIPNIFIFKDIKIKNNDVFYYCSFLETFRTEGYIANADPINTDFYPATREQRNILFAKMKESGYEWDAEKKELKDIEQKPTWSEEDETVLDNLIYALSNDRIGNDRDEYVDWLKSIKNRVIPQPKQEWSEEDESRITTICTYLQDYARLSGSELRTIRINEYCDWLKSLRPQNRWKPSDEQMNALLDATLQYSQVSQNSFERLNSLFNDLKKLKG